ncbi:non-LTR retrotransposon CATS, partial [Striga asiatica]
MVLTVSLRQNQKLYPLGENTSKDSMKLWIPISRSTYRFFHVSPSFPNPIGWAHLSRAGSIRESGVCLVIEWRGSVLGMSGNSKTGKSVCLLGREKKGIFELALLKLGTDLDSAV